MCSDIVRRAPREHNFDVFIRLIMRMCLVEPLLIASLRQLWRGSVMQSEVAWKHLLSRCKDSALVRD
jgi:hypothetical protein